MKELPEFAYLITFIYNRLEGHFGTHSDMEEPKLLSFNKWSLHVPEIVKNANLTKEEKPLLLLVICPHVLGHLLDEVIQGKLNGTGDFPQLGGVRGKNFRGFLPTGQTALFLLAGDNVKKRRAVYELFDPDHFFEKERILWLEEAPEGEPRMSGKIIMNPDYVEQFLVGKVSNPRFSMRFPAEVITTQMEWEDLVLTAETHEQILELKDMDCL